MKSEVYISGSEASRLLAKSGVMLGARSLARLARGGRLAAVSCGSHNLYKESEIGALLIARTSRRASPYKRDIQRFSRRDYRCVLCGDTATRRDQWICDAHSDACIAAEILRECREIKSGQPRTKEEPVYPMSPIVRQVRNTSELRQALIEDYLGLRSGAISVKDANARARLAVVILESARIEVTVPTEPGATRPLELVPVSARAAE